MFRTPPSPVRFSVSLPAICPAALEPPPRPSPRPANPPAWPSKVCAPPPLDCSDWSVLLVSVSPGSECNVFCA